MKKEDAVHIYNRILLSHIKEWNKAICSNVNAPRGLSHWLKGVRERQISYDSPYMWNPKKYVTNEIIYRVRCRKQTFKISFILKVPFAWHLILFYFIPITQLEGDNESFVPLFYSKSFPQWYIIQNHFFFVVVLFHFF